MDCIFCKIGQKIVPSLIVWENKDFLAFLDIAPAVEGMTVVVPKKHYSANIFSLKKEEYSALFLTTYEVAQNLKKALNAEKVFIVVEGMEVDHVHVKLYPLPSGESYLLSDLLNKEREEKSIEDLQKTFFKIKKI